MTDGSHFSNASDLMLPTVANISAGTPTNGQVTVTEQVPGGLTLVSMAGPSWVCPYLPVCLRTDSLPAGSSYPPLTVTVNVLPDANSPQVNSVSVTGGGAANASTTDSTNIVPPATSSLIITHAGYFTQGQIGAVYSVTVHNPVSSLPTVGTVTVSELAPASFTLVSMSGTGWSCPTGGTVCTRSDSIPAGTSYPPITVTVNVGASAPVNVVNQATVSIGGLATITAADPTLVNTAPVSYLISTYAGGIPAPTAVVGTNYALGWVTAVATDLFGNVYLTGSNAVFKLDPNGFLTRVAGTGVPGWSGDGGPALNAQLNYPVGLAVDSSGNLYIADGQNNRVRKVTGGIITTVAGTGGLGFSGDGGPAVSAQLNYPSAVAVDSAGNLYIADSNNNRIRKLAGGVITTVAGGSTSSGENVPATEAKLLYPAGIVVDSVGSLYIAESSSERIRKVTLGIVNTVLQLASPMNGIGIDSAGTLYIAGFSSVIGLSSTGTVSLLVGGGSFGFSGDGGPGINASLNGATGVAVGPNGNLYIADQQNQRLRMLTPGGTISTAAGNGLFPQPGGDGGPAALAQLSSPQGLAIDSGGNLYIAENGDVRKVSPAGIASSLPKPGYCCNYGPVAVDSGGNVYVAGNAMIFKITPGGTSTTVAGNGQSGYSEDNGPATSAELSAYVLGLAVDRGGNLYIADTWNYAVRKVTPNGTITTVAGRDVAGRLLTYPTGLAVDATGNLYIADLYSSSVFELTPDGTFSTVAGGTQGNGGDGGPATSAQLDSPNGVAVDSSGALFITSSGTVRKVSPAGIISTVAGNVTWGYSGDGGPAINAQLDVPVGLAVDRFGNVYVADSNNNAVRLLQPAGAEPLLNVSSTHSGIFTLGQTGATYTVAVNNAPTAATTSGTVTVTDIIPAGLTLVSMSGADWSCTAYVCTSTDAVRGGSSYSPIAVTVNVAANALPQVINEVSVSLSGLPPGGAIDPTFIGPAKPVLAIAASQSGVFVQGQLTAAGTLLVANQAGAAATSGQVTVTESLPANLTLVSMKGNGWTCTANSCWRSDSLAGGTVYDPISVETAVQSNAPSVAMNQISVAGGGSDGASVTQFLSIAPFTCDISGDGAIDVVDVQTLADEVFGLIPAVHDLNHDGVVGVADVQKLINAALGMGCPYQ